MLFACVVIFSVSVTLAQNTYQQSMKFVNFIDFINKYYVDTTNTNELVEDAIVEILRNLDPHSTYITAEDVKRMNEPLEGNFEGIGISFNILNDTLFVISPISGGPSERVGVRAGDRIIKVNDENIAGVGLTNERVFALLKGKKGTRVKISVLRRNVNELIDFEIIRDKIPIFSIDASYMIDNKTGYIKISRFAGTTYDEFVEASRKLIEKGAKNLILDLTNNGGGYLDAAVRLADEFLEQDKLIVYTEGTKSPRQEFLATGEGHFEDSKVAVLIDEGSASASEILTGAIQDWDKGIVIGRRSFGKGLVQRQLPLIDGSAVRLTVSRYYTPSGRLIQKPYDHGVDDYYHEIYDRFNNMEHLSKDSINFPDSLKYSTLTYKRTVYGGGGIMPDIFIPYDTSYYSDYYRDALRKGIFNQFVLTYVDDHRKELNNKYPTFDKFNANFQIDKNILNQLISYAEKEGLPENKEEFAVSEEHIKVLLKAYIARDIWNTSEFYEIFNSTSNVYKKAIDVITHWDNYYSQIMQ